MSNAIDRTLSDLVNEVVRHPERTLEDRSDAARSLARAGRAGAEAVLQRMVDGWKSEAHPRDVIEALAYVLQRVAAAEPEILVDMSRRELPADPHITLITWSLWNAAISRRAQSLSTSMIENRLRELTDHENEFVRWASEEGLKALGLPPNSALKPPPPAPRES